MRINIVKVESFKLLLETILLCVGVIYAVAFAWRTWPYPSGVVSLTEQNRVADANKTTDTVLLQAEFALGDKSNFDISRVMTTCEIVDSSLECQVECPKIDVLLAQGRLSAGDSFTWSCRSHNVPKDSCVLFTMNITGTAPFPAWGESRWWSTYLSCPAND